MMRAHRLIKVGEHAWTAKEKRRPFLMRLRR